MSWQSETVAVVSPMSTTDIEHVARAVLQHLAPVRWREPGTINYEELVDRRLAGEGVHFYPETMGSKHLGFNEAVTRIRCEALDMPIEVFMEEDQYDALFEGGPLAYRPRATCLHELGHVAMHVFPLRRRLLRMRANPELDLNRACRGQIPAYHDPEWQAWTFAGFLAAPRHHVVELADLSVDELAVVFGVSSQFMASHLRRMRIERK